jgi:hypothetical protein
VPLYFRGDVGAAEQTGNRWCREHALPQALAGFSAGWRLAPDVRYTVGAVYLDERGFDPPLLEQLITGCGGKRVESGANLFLWRLFDPSVFADSRTMAPEQEPVTSPLQTYLDLKWSAGRGEDAATAIFDKYLRHDLEAAAKEGKQRPRGPV